MTTDPFFTANADELIAAIHSGDDDRARQIADHMAAANLDAAVAGTGYALAAAFTAAAFAAKANGRQQVHDRLLEQRARLCTPEQIADATTAVTYRVGIHQGWLDAASYDRVDEFVRGMGARFEEPWKAVQRRDSNG